MDVKRGWLKRHWVAVSIATALGLTLGGVGGWLYSLNQRVDEVPRVPVTLDDEERPVANTSRDLNILLAGADNGSGKSIAEEIAAGTWTPTATTAATPSWSCTWAFADYGPSGYIATVEELTGLRMDHLAIMDWDGFMDLSTAVGGVEVCITETLYDESQDIAWEKGCQNLEGKEALAYVRTRYGLENGDFDRIKRQQNFVRALMGKILSNESRSEVDGITAALDAVTENPTVDEGWETEDIRKLAISLRNLETEDVTFLTAPMERYDYTDDGQSIVVLDEKQNKVLWRSVGNDRVSKYVRTYGAESGVLGDPDTVG